MQTREDVVINFSPSLVVNYATELVSLVRNINVTYSLSSGEALNTDGPLGVVAVEDPIEIVEVAMLRTCNTLIAIGLVLSLCKTFRGQVEVLGTYS